MGKKLEIYVSHYKDYYRYKNEMFKHFFVGNKLNKKNNTMKLPGDDTGDNISEKNASFCELTLMYWVWKNTHQDYVGFCHYRRFLIYNDENTTKNKKIVKFINRVYNGVARRILKNKDWKEKYIEKKLDEFVKNIGNDISKFDVILPHPVLMPMTLRENYYREHIGEHYDLIGEIIQEKYPDVYESYLSASNKNTIYLANIFIIAREIYNELSQFLFTILFELEKKIEVPKDTREQRVFGFLSERLVTIYLEYLLKEKNYRVKHLEFLNTDMIYGQIKSSKIENKEKRKINNRITTVQIDDLKKITINHYMLMGWGIINEEASLNSKAILELYKDDEIIRYSNFEAYRNDITQAFSKEKRKYFNYDSSGFNFFIDKNELKPGNYKIRVRFDMLNSNESSINYVFNKYLYVDERKKISLVVGE